MKNDELGIEELRRAVSLFNGCRESLTDGLSAEQILSAYRSYRDSERSFSPDSWTGRQFVGAVAGIPPRWDEDEEPVYNEVQGET